MVSLAFEGWGFEWMWAPAATARVSGVLNGVDLRNYTEASSVSQTNFPVPFNDDRHA